MINSEKFAERLQKILDYYNLSATALAENLDFNRSTISHLVNGRNKPSLEFVIKILREFPEVEMDWLLFGKGSFPALKENTGSSKKKEDKPERSLKTLDLFSESPEKSGEDFGSNERKNGDIEKIVILYKDGSFKLYHN